MKRRTFIKTTSLIGAASTLLSGTSLFSQTSKPKGAIVVNTWDYGENVSGEAYSTITKGGGLLNGLEKAIRIPEADPKVTSVGRGGMPDRDGRLTLDACIMDGDGNCGSVMFLEHIAHPVSVARTVMEKTQHVVLAGEGALQFAMENGFKKENLLSDNAKKEYKKWLKESKYKKAPIGKGNHDTIGMIAMDADGKMAGACSTSGMAWKVRGRVGDSPIIGAGLYVDNEVGAATATGIGEAVIKICGTFLIVELMRQGKSPQEACRTALERILRKQPKYKAEDNFLVGFCAFNKAGEHGGICYKKGFEYAVYQDGKYEVIKAESLVK